MNTRAELRRSARAQRAIRWSKPLLIEALRNMPTLCPPNISRQSHAYLEGIVRGALSRDDNDAIRLAMQRALVDARKVV